MLDGIELLPLTRELLPSLARLEALCFSEPWSEESLAFLLGDTALGLAAVLPSGEVVGYMGAVTVLDEGQVTDIAVLPEYRRRGIAGGLLRLFESLAAERGIKFLSLEVRASNLSALALYGSLGWVRAGLRKNFYRHPSEDAVIMTKTI